MAIKRRCYTCKRSKTLSCFLRDKTRPRGRAYQCRKCKNSEAVRRYGTNCAMYAARYRAQNIAKYGITLYDFAQLRAAQNNLCAICQQPETTRTNSGRVRRLCIDHDHRTNKVRGLLCVSCNRALGLLRDKPELLRKASIYLEQHA